MRVLVRVGNVTPRLITHLRSLPVTAEKILHTNDDALLESDVAKIAAKEGTEMAKVADMLRLAKLFPALFDYLDLLINLVKLAEIQFGPKTGADKKKAVKIALAATLQTLKAHDVTGDEKLEKLLDGAIDYIVMRLNATGDMPFTEPQPDLTPTL